MIQPFPCIILIPYKIYFPIYILINSLSFRNANKVIQNFFIIFFVLLMSFIHKLKYFELIKTYFIYYLSINSQILFYYFYICWECQHYEPSFSFFFFLLYYPIQSFHCSVYIKIFQIPNAYVLYLLHLNQSYFFCKYYYFNVIFTGNL